MAGDSDPAARLGGTNGHVQLPADLGTLTGGLTVEAWVYPTNNASWARVLDLGAGQQSDNILLARNGSSNALTFEVYSGSASGGQVTAPGALVPNTWQHLAATVDAAGNAMLYRNGTAVASGHTAAPRAVTRSNNYVGRSNWAADRYFQGTIDELAIYGSVLSADRVRTHYRAALPPTRALPFADGAESGGDGWTADRPWSPALHSLGDPSRAGAMAWTDSPGGNYTNGTTASLTSPRLDVTAAAGGTVTVSYWARYDIEGGWDHAYVEYQLDGGTWQSLADLTGVVGPDYQQRTHAITVPAGARDLLVRWRLVTDNFGTRDGLHLDDVQIYAGTTPPPPAPPPPSGATLPATFTYRGDGLRHSRAAGGSTATYTWDVNRSLPVVLQDGTFSYVYGLGGALLSQTDIAGAQT